MYILWNAPSPEFSDCHTQERIFKGKSACQLTSEKVWSSVSPWATLLINWKLEFNFFQALWPTNGHWEPRNVTQDSFEWILSNVNENNFLLAREESRTEKKFYKYLPESWSTLNSTVSFCFSQIFKITSMIRKDSHNLTFFFVSVIHCGIGDLHQALQDCQSNRYIKQRAQDFSS